MKIVCPECEAAYEIDVPDSPSKNLSAKCAACHTTFPIKKRSLAESNHAHDSMTGPPLAQIDSGLAEESTDDFLSGLQEDLKGFEGLDHPLEESADEEDLDDYLNQLVEEDVGEPDKEVLSESNSPSATDSDQPTAEMPSEDDLDHLFDSLIAEEIKSPEKAEDIADADTFSEKDQEDGDLDALLDEIILNNLDEEDEPKPEPPASEIEEVDEPVSGPLVDEEQEIEIPELENLSSENVDDEISEEDFLAKVLSQEETLSEVESQEDSKETSEDIPETTDSAPATEQQEKSADDPSAETVVDQEATKETDDNEPAAEQEEEKSDEDLWAEAFADQEATKESGDNEPAAEQEEEKSDEDLWAEAFADQEATKESDDNEPAAEQEEEKSDEDLWAEAFADQEATKEADDNEPVAEQEEEKSDEDSDQADESEEPSEADDSGADAPDKEVTAEEIVAADVAMDLEEDDDPGEDTIANEFGISESDYDDDDEDEAEFSPPGKKKSLFSLPATRMGKLVLGGGVLAILLTAGGAYFALQTLAPSELTDMAKSPSEVPEGLQPKDTQENTAPQSPSENTSPSPSEKPNPALTAALGTDEPPSPRGDTKNPASTDSFAGTENSSGPSRGLVAALAPGNHAVQLATIMPVAYSINDIRVLSFNLEAEMSDAKSAQVIREAMPVFEKITVTTVEQLMDKKFFNDILYVKEKLKKNLQNNFNKTLEGGGRVKKITFKEFTVR
jgi:predicted Zn finger-like uncharacterized protein